MIDPALILPSYPSIGPWLKAGTWVRSFGKATVERAREYANSRSIKVLHVVGSPAEKFLAVLAGVDGTARAPYNTGIVFHERRGGLSVSSECSCPVGLYCKHGAAILLFLEKTSSAPGRGAQQARREDPVVEAWLKELSAAAGTQESTVPAKSGSAAKFLAYCLEESAYDHPDRFHFFLRIGTRKKDGTVSIQSGTASADPSKPAKYMAREDIIPASLYRQRLAATRSWGSAPMRGGGWDELLTEALATGRLFFGAKPEFRHQSPVYRPMTGGPAETVEAVWETLPNGGARPVLRGLGDCVVIIPTIPVRYLDAETGMIGLVESSLPPAVLAAWARGPVVKAESLENVTGHFSGISGTTLPAPRPLEIDRRPAVRPVPILLIAPREIGPSWNPEVFLTGDLLFTYGDSPRLQPLAPGAAAEHAVTAAGIRTVWPRNPKAERAAEKRLVSGELKPLTYFLRPDFLPGSASRAVLPTPLHGGGLEFAWLQWLDGPEATALRNDGWILEADPAAGLTVRDVTDFVPAIEKETAHGIDWFRFDLSYEADGQRFSLIPLVARAIEAGLPPADSPDLPEFITLPGDTPEQGFLRFPAKRLMEIVDQVRHLFLGNRGDGPPKLDTLAAAGLADALSLNTSGIVRALATLGRNLRNISGLPAVPVPEGVRASLRPYQQDGFRWLQFLSDHGLNGILADDMGLGKTLQTLTHLAAAREKADGRPSLVVAPTSVVPNWAAEAAKFVPDMNVVALQGADRATRYKDIAGADVVLTSYPLLVRDIDELSTHGWHTVVLDEAQYIKNPKAKVAENACLLKASHRFCLSGTPMENHLGELWSLMRFLMPGLLGDEKSFNSRLRRPIEREQSPDARLALNRRIAPLILRRTKDQVAADLPAKTEIIHHIDLNTKQTDIYEAVRASMDKRVREAIAAKGLAKSHIIVLDALLKLRQICCHPVLLKTGSKQAAADSAKLVYLTTELLPTLIEEGRRILLFSQFTSMLALIVEHLERAGIPFLMLTGQTKNRAELVKTFQSGTVPIFLISLKAGGTGLNLTAADTVIHYDPWWNPAAENQATDRSHRIGQTKPVFVHKLICRGTIEDRILELQKHKAALVEAVLSEETTALKIDAKTLEHLLAPLD